MERKQASSSLQIDNDHLRVTEWRFAPGAATGTHIHEHDYVVVPVCDGELEVVAADGASTVTALKRGGSYFRTAGVAHDVVNAGPGEMIFVEIELKDTGIRRDNPGVGG